MRSSIEGVTRERLVDALRAFGLADLRADPLSPLPLELALADAISPPPAASTVAAATAAPAVQRPPAARQPQPPPRQPQPPPRQAQPPRVQPAASPAQPPPRAQPAPAAPRQDAPIAGAERVPDDLRKDLSKASAEDIARMLGSDAPVIPPAGEETAAPVHGTTTNGAATPAAASGGIDLDAFVDAELRPLARARSVKLDALLNGSCRAVSWQDGILTLGFYVEGFHKKGVEETANRRIYEELAAEALGGPASIRCIVAAKPARPIAKSPLVEHAVQTHGATIVSQTEAEER
jgi:hypothetical protein